MVAKDRETGEEIEVNISHQDIVTNTGSEIPKLMEKIPENYDVSAYIFSGGQSDNPYLQMDILKALVDSKRIQSIKYNFHEASNVVVDLSGGKVMTADIVEDSETSYSIGDEFPVEVDFVPNTFKFRENSIRQLSWSLIEVIDYYNDSFEGTLDLKNVSFKTLQEPQVPTVEEEFRKLANDEEGITLEELQESVDEISELLGNKAIEIHYKKEKEDNVILGVAYDGLYISRPKDKLRSSLPSDDGVVR